MAINAYVGLQGSGKSYQVVAFPILEAVQKGRRVVTTIHGIETEKVRAYLEKKGRGQPGKMGEVIVVEEEEVQKPNFFPSRYIEVDGTKVVYDAETLVKGGDLVVLDEAWKFYGTGVKPTTEHFTFFREHRHYLHPETEVTCDLILLTQNIEDLCKSVRGVIEATFRTVKLKALGLNNRYRVEQYQGSRLTKAAKVDVTTGRSYDLEICALYQSHAGGVVVSHRVV
ncbi:zonular occludens toxin (Zot) [mine drainage metagenome]|uniref:Zonular occludens toxin (Zot) n=1 Tax=mine drainage metagenome TaxID=410659 RepID=A0A1J5QD11_9ZZZZ